MDFLGMIAAPDGKPALVYEDWARLVTGHPNLERVAPRQGVNPFTRQPMMFQGSPGEAHVMVAGEAVGEMHWALDDSARIVVAGDAARVRPIALDIAARLAAHYLPGT
jgi:hypothetical protein